MFPIPPIIGTIFKWGAIFTIVTTIGWAVKSGYEYHLDQIDAAVNTAKLEFAVEKEEALNKREKILREEAKEDLKVIEQELKVERAKVTDLRRMLLIDHDLDRLLQRKPGLILPRVNKGTEEVLLELEELTQ
jgi:hypothetical protein